MARLESPSILTLLMDRLMPEEGRVTNSQGRHIVYRDSKGIETLGYGRNVRDRGLSEDEARYLLENDASQAVVDITTAWPPFAFMMPARKIVLCDLYFNMSEGNVAHFLSEFKPTLDLMMAGKYDEAAAHMRGWKWYTDVGPKRADPLIQMMLTGNLVEPSHGEQG